MKTLAEVRTDYLTAAPGLVVPEAVLVGAACACFLLAAFYPRRGAAVLLGLLGVVGAAVAAALLGNGEVNAFWEMARGTEVAYPRAVAPIDPTGPAGFVRGIALLAAGLFLLIGWPEVRDGTAGEYVGCVLVAAAGTSLCGRANDLVSLFLALEMVSIPTYVLLYLPARSAPGQEAAAKYFLLSILSSAVLLFGFSYLYGLTGSTNLGVVVDVLTDAAPSGVNPLALLAGVMVVAGLGFRLAAVPFHFYAPDVYEGGPTGVVGQLAFLPKVVGFVALARVLGMLYPPLDKLPFDDVRTQLPLVLWVLAAVTMTVGNAVALWQSNLRRLFAYSGIAHTGYMLLGLVVASSLPDGNGREPAQTGIDAILFYLAAYGLMTVGAFAVFAAVRGPDGPAETVDDLAGLGHTHPAAAALLSVFLLSLIGIPLTAGFAAKFNLFVGAFEVPAGSPLRTVTRVLALVAAVNAAVGAVYYLRLLGAMYQRAPVRPESAPGQVLPLAAAAVCAAGTILFGCYPDPLLSAARRAAPFAPPPAAAALAAGAGNPTP